MILENINGVQDVKKLSLKELKILADEIRAYLIDTLKITGGHLASNLGVVEATLALHYVFNSPEDKILFDVGHQSYVHKIITGRREELKTIRKFGGISGFPLIEESPHDAFDAGHAGGAISAALGLTRAKELRGETHNVIAFVGDGALTNGMTFEALNDVANTQSKMLIVLNDNEMSISRNVGALSKSMNRLRTSRGYLGVKRGVKGVLSRIPLIGKPLERLTGRVKDRIKYLFVRDRYFRNFGVNYIGPADGHNLKALISILRRIKNNPRGKTDVLHIFTQKGRGYDKAEQSPEFFHGVNADFKAGGEKSFSSALGETLCEMAADDPRVAAVTAAMPEGTGLTAFKEAYPARFFDTGITEEHAVTLAAGMAKGGLKPYAAIYSTFLQRALDQIITDAALMKLPVTFCIDRAGLSGADGKTHQGAFDLSYLSLIPDMTIFAPKDITELKNVLRWSLSFPAPLAIRYPKSADKEYSEHAPVELGKWEYTARTDSKISILAVGGRMLALAEKVSALLTDKPSIISARFVKPLDTALLERLISEKHTLVTLEDNSLKGGFGSLVASFNAASPHPAKLLSFGLPDRFIEHGSVAELFGQIGLTPECVAERIREME